MLPAALRPAEINPAKLAALYRRELRGPHPHGDIVILPYCRYVVDRAAARVFPGNFLFSTGPNTQGGGRRTTRGHYDVPMRDCTVRLDGRTIIEAGRIVEPRLAVERVAR